MRFLVLVLAACGGSARPPAGPVPTPVASGGVRPADDTPAASGGVRPAGDVLAYCDLAVRAVDELTACRDAGEAFRSLRDMFSAARGHEPSFARKDAAQCATFVESIAVDREVADCTFSFRARRAEVTSFLDAYYASKTLLEPTGHAVTDGVLGKVARIRDATCACADADCAQQAARALDEPGVRLPPDAPTRARDLAVTLLDEVLKCSSDARFSRPRS